MKKIKPLLISLCLCAAFAQTPLPALAAAPAQNTLSAFTHHTASVSTDESGESEGETEIVPVLLDTDVVSADDILLYSGAGIVMDAESGAVLYYKNPFDKKYPASLTKIMTALTALNHSSLSETVTVSQNALDNITWDSTHLGVIAGQTLTMEEALYAVIVTSANDIANAVAEHVAGSMDAFVDMMNDYARELGCYHTHFMNPNGLHDDNHYMSVYDAAIISKTALANPDFVKMISANFYQIDSEIIKPEKETTYGYTQESEEPTYYELYSHHKMINQTFPYPYAYGGKTGYTDTARNTLATFAKKEDMNLICILYDAPGGNDYIYKDTAALLDYCFDNYQALAENVTLSAPDSNAWKLFSPSDNGLMCSQPVPVPKSPQAGQTLENYALNNFILYDQIAETSLFREDHSLEKTFAERAYEWIDFSDPENKTPQEWFIGIVIILLCLIFIIILLHLLIHSIMRKRRRMRYHKLKKRRLAQEASRSSETSQAKTQETGRSSEAEQTEAQKNPPADASL